jgi:SAM-dependent methyltransferase
MTTITASAAGDYSELAPLYDAFTAASDYEAWTSHVLALAGTLGLRGTRLLDVACGTGKSLLPFARRGFEVTGCDISTAMLAEARRKSPEVPLVEADMRALPKLGSFDLVTCFDDSLNHLLDEGELASALASMAANLAAAGLLLFDLNTLLAYRSTFAVDSVWAEGETTFVCHGDATADAPPECRAAVWVDVFAPRDDGLYERLSARLAQRHFPAHRVTALLGSAGLECLGVYGVLDDGSLVPEPDETRQMKLLYAATLAEGGDSQ